jgi:hypothetical protein
VLEEVRVEVETGASVVVVLHSGRTGTEAPGVSIE